VHRGHIVGTIWAQLQLTAVNYGDAFQHVEAVLTV
jgi:hypothetical protein